mgnify:CR=1 FL=1
MSMKKLSIIFILILIILFILLFIFFPSREKKEGREGNLAEEMGKLNEKIEGGGEIGEIPISWQSCDFFPLRNQKESLPELREEAGIAILFSPKGKEQILYQKDIDKKLPPASLTKLMTAIIVTDNFPLDKKVKVSQEAVWTLGESGRLSPQEEISIRGLLDLCLLVSSNDAASALTEVVGKEKFLNLMNEKIKKIGLKETHLVNAHGLDEKKHYSTAYDLALMTQYSILHHPLIWETLGTEEKDIIGKDHLKREILHHARNTNKLLSSQG